MAKRAAWFVMSVASAPTTRPRTTQWKSPIRNDFNASRRSLKCGFHLLGLEWTMKNMLVAIKIELSMLDLASIVIDTKPRTELTAGMFCVQPILSLAD
jgi:hypothetical protein